MVSAVFHIQRIDWPFQNMPPLKIIKTSQEGFTTKTITWLLCLILLFLSHYMDGLFT